MVGDLCKTHCSKFAHFIIFLYLYSMKQRPSFPSFADLIVGHRKVKQTFFFCVLIKGLTNLKFFQNMPHSRATLYLIYIGQPSSSDV